MFTFAVASSNLTAHAASPKGSPTAKSSTDDWAVSVVVGAFCGHLDIPSRWVVGIAVVSRFA